MSGIVKKLIFPAYTDAGANATFQDTAQNNPQHDENGGGDGSSGGIEDHEQPTGESMDDTRSEATTTIHDNRTNRHLFLPPTPKGHHHQHTSNNNSSSSGGGKRLHGTFVSHPPPKRSPDGGATTTTFFPTTRPNSIKSRTVSTTARAGATTFSAASPKRSITDVLFPATSPKPQADSTTTATTSTTTTTTTTTPFIIESTSTSLNYSTMSTASSVVGQCFIPEQQQDGDEEEMAEQEEYKAHDNRSEKIEDNSTELDDGVSNVSSTASEMGTVVNMPSRLAEIDNFLSPSNLPDAGEGGEYDDNDGDSDDQQDKRDQQADSQAQLQQESNTNNDHTDNGDHTNDDGLSLPLLDEARQSSSSAAMMMRLRTKPTFAPIRPRPTMATGTASAPTTPRARPTVEEYLKSAAPSLSLRSPGAATHFSNNNNRNSNSVHPMLSPRFGSGSGSGTFRLRSGSQSSDQNPGLRHASSLASPLRFARNCVSFDQTQSTATSIETQPTFPESISSREHKPSQVQKKPTLEPKGSTLRNLLQSKSWDEGSLSGSLHSNNDKNRDSNKNRSIEPFKDDDNGDNSGDDNGNPDDHVTPIKETSVIKQERAFRETAFDNRVLHGKAELLRLKPEDIGQPAQDFSPAIVNTKNALALRTPQRVEIEREDALDILACFVERSAVFEKEVSPDVKPTTTARGEKLKSNNASFTSDQAKPDDDKVSTFAQIGERDRKGADDDDDSSMEELHSPAKIRRKPMGSVDMLEANEALSDELIAAIDSLRKASRTSSSSDVVNHQTRMKALDELVRSHCYAGEMKQASRSASAWLQSIRKFDVASSVGGTIQEEEEEEEEETEVNRAKGDNKVGNPVAKVDGSAVCEEEVTQFTEKMNLLAFKAMIHSSEQKALEKEEEAKRLNEQLSECRAEIGRLRSASRAEVLFKSPNRSILDRSIASEETDEVSQTNADVNPLDLSTASPIPVAGTEVGDTVVDASFCRSDFLAPNEQGGADDNRGEWSALSEAKREAILLRAALAEANETIRKLHAASRTESNNDEQRDDVVPVVSATDNQDLSKELDEYKEIVRQELRSSFVNISRVENEGTDTGEEGRMIHVRMLDGENFVTDWDELAQPLSPPPDHGLRSPIVGALLEQWTSDRSMHDSLLTWMDRVTNGEDPENIPPLTISSLDHQVRDGFAMHIIPLLLKRPDIRVAVKSRAHRRTTYDMSVTVTRNVQMSQLIQSQQKQAAESAINPKSTAAHAMAFRASSNGTAALLDDSVAIDEENIEARVKVGSYLQSSNLTAGPSESWDASVEVGSGSVTHSAATEQITNRLLPAEPRLRIREASGAAAYARFDYGSVSGDEDISVTSSRASQPRSNSGAQQQAGLMTAIGNTFGDLLGRASRKAPSHQSLSSYDGSSVGGASSVNNDDFPDVLPVVIRNPLPSASSKDQQDSDTNNSQQQPYHRVVSAPPGRIGVTFVQYRGHAMVSDVAPESPLSGWVFASDILIAIDEVPVSGMRVRDIVKLLTTRKDRQRALRVISSHAMKELTLNQTSLADQLQ